MSNAIDNDLYQRTKALLEPGEIQLNGAIIHTEYEGSEDVQMMQATIDVGDIIAEHSGHDPQDCYVYSGNDDTDFSSNQHQGLTLDDEEFVWECQQLLRNGSFAIVIYYKGSADHDAILADIEALGFDVTGVEGD
ncbi:hypothetical protein C483_06023 [Natrialba hulunbeirensis JCM 10989]|uniref:Uncharacterized protein n=1 Tax=Natrialba hulunbeirensis JCM 10989 TaxID=1227493 RepID=M0A850_9EURY|nr:DUF5778 family protein [Natrialba hulunbeirensis]ELY93498.1 hypothetical protein C483_06023 [Natrialba hulunbeirensis JCM 10989]